MTDRSRWATLRHTAAMLLVCAVHGHVYVRGKCLRCGWPAGVE